MQFPIIIDSSALPGTDYTLVLTLFGANDTPLSRTTYFRSVTTGLYNIGIIHTQSFHLLPSLSPCCLLSLPLSLSLSLSVCLSVCLSPLLSVERFELNCRAYYIAGNSETDSSISIICTPASDNTDNVAELRYTLNGGSEETC